MHVWPLYHLTGVQNKQTAEYSTTLIPATENREQGRGRDTREGRTTNSEYGGRAGVVTGDGGRHEEAGRGWQGRQSRPAPVQAIDLWAAAAALA